MPQGIPFTREDLQNKWGEQAAWTPEQWQSWVATGQGPTSQHASPQSAYGTDIPSGFQRPSMATEQVESPESSFRRRLMRSQAEANTAQEAGLPFTSTNVNMENIQDPTMRGVLQSRASMRPQIAPTSEYGSVAPANVQGGVQSGFHRTGGVDYFGPQMAMGAGRPINQSVTPVVGGEGPEQPGRTIFRGQEMPTSEVDANDAMRTLRRQGQRRFRDYMDTRDALGQENSALGGRIAGNSADFDRMREVNRGGAPTLPLDQIAANVQEQARLRGERGMGPRAFAKQQRRQEQMQQMQQMGMNRAAMGGNRFAQQGLLNQQKFGMEEGGRQDERDRQNRQDAERKNQFDLQMKKADAELELMKQRNQTEEKQLDATIRSQMESEVDVELTRIIGDRTDLDDQQKEALREQIKAKKLREYGLSAPEAGGGQQPGPGGINVPPKPSGSFPSELIFGVPGAALGIFSPGGRKRGREYWDKTIKPWWSGE